MNFYTKLALKNTIRHPIRSLITIFGISLGVAIILAVAMLNDTTRHSIEHTIEALGSGKTDIWVEEFGEKTASIGTRQEGFPEAIIQTVSAHPAVLSVHPALKIYATGGSNPPETYIGFYLYGVRFIDDRTVRSYILSEGHYPENSRQILIGQRLAEEFTISVGSPLILQSPKGQLSLEVCGLLKSDKGIGVSHNNRIGFAALNVIQDFFNYNNRITSLNIVLTSDANPLGIADELRGLFPEKVRVMTDPLMVASKGDESGQLRTVLRIYSGISMIIAMFIIYNTLTSIVEERRREIGMLRLIGMTSRQVIVLFLRQALIYGLLGSATGVGCGIILGWGMITLLQRLIAYQSFPLILPSYVSLFTAIGTGILVTIVVALFPAMKTANIPPLVVFRERETEREQEHRVTLRTIIGIVLIAMALVVGNLSISGKLFAIIRLTMLIVLFLGLIMTFSYIFPWLLHVFSVGFAKIVGVPGMLAVKNLRLRLKRTITTVSAIVVVAAVSIGTLGVVIMMKQTTSEWLDDTRWADVLIFSSSGAEMDESIAKTVMKLSFVQDMNPIRYFFVPYDHPKLSDNGFIFQAVYPARFRKFTGVEVVEGNTSDAFQHLEQRYPAIIINAGLAKMLGLKQGDTITLETQKGATDFSILGSVVDYTDFVHRLGKIVYGSYHTLNTYWGAKGYTVLQVRLIKGYSEDVAKTQLLQELSGTYDIKILTHREEKEEVGASIDKIFASNYAITVIMFMIVFMGIFNTVFINVLFQIKEFAILRTLGLLRRQTRLMVICEALAMGMIGGGFSVITGIWFTWQMILGTQELMGILFQFHIPWIMIGVIFLIILPIAIAATIYPQRIVSGISLARILQREE